MNINKFYFLINKIQLFLLKILDLLLITQKKKKKK